MKDHGMKALRIGVSVLLLIFLVYQTYSMLYKPITTATAVAYDTYEGVEITGYVKLPDTAKTAMSIVAAADYTLYFKEGYEVPMTTEAFAQGIKEYFTDQKEVLITKQTKKSEKVMDLKQLVYAFDVKELDGKPSFYINVSTGSSDNLKPELVLESLFAHLGLEYDPNAIQIHRMDVYAATEDGNGYISLGDMGEIIQ